MSTRALIARPTDPDDPSKFEGIYLHSDGYPEHTGIALFAQITLHFKGDRAAALDYYINQHPTGWRYLSGDAGIGGNECYCHDAGEGEQLGWIVNQDKAHEYDYTYIVREEGLELRRFGRGSITVPWDRERFDWHSGDERLKRA
jgi:hypothetical protein